MAAGGTVPEWQILLEPYVVAAEGERHTCPPFINCIDATMIVVNALNLMAEDSDAEARGAFQNKLLSVEWFRNGLYSGFFFDELLKARKVVKSAALQDEAANKAMNSWFMLNLQREHFVQSYRFVRELSALSPKALKLLLELNVQDFIKQKSDCVVISAVFEEPSSLMGRFFFPYFLMVKSQGRMVSGIEHIDRAMVSVMCEMICGLYQSVKTKESAQFVMNVLTMVPSQLLTKTAQGLLAALRSGWIYGSKWAEEAKQGDELSTNTALTMCMNEMLNVDFMSWLEPPSPEVQRILDAGTVVVFPELTLKQVYNQLILEVHMLRGALPSFDEGWNPSLRMCASLWMQYAKMKVELFVEANRGTVSGYVTLGYDRSTHRIKTMVLATAAEAGAEFVEATRNLLGCVPDACTEYCVLLS